MDPREQIELAMEQALAEITIANGYNIPRDIQQVTRVQEVITAIPDADRPLLLLLTEVEASEFIELSLLEETWLTVNVRVYETLYPGEDGATVLNQYTAAIRQCLIQHRYWDGLAEFTEIRGVAQHQILEEMRPNIMTTVAARINYLHEDSLS